MYIMGIGDVHEQETVRYISSCDSSSSDNYSRFLYQVFQIRLTRNLFLSRGLIALCL